MLKKTASGLTVAIAVSQAAASDSSPRWDSLDSSAVASSSPDRIASEDHSEGRAHSFWSEELDEPEWTEQDQADLMKFAVLKARGKATRNDLESLDQLQRRRDRAYDRPTYEQASLQREREKKVQGLLKALSDYVEFIDVETK